MILLVLFIFLKVLTYRSSHYLLGNHTHLILQEITIQTSGIQIAKIIHEILSTHTVCLIQGILQYLDSTSIGYAMCQRNIISSSASEVLFYLLVYHLHDIRNTAHIRLRHHGWHIEVIPIMVITDETRLHIRNFLILHLVKFRRKRLQDLTLTFTNLNLLKILKERWIDREQIDIFFYVGMHVRKELYKLAEMLADKIFLILILTKQTLLNNKLHILLSNGYLAITVVDTSQHIGSKLELRSIINQLLHSKYHTELGMITRLSQSLKHSQVAIQSIISSTTLQIRQHLIYNYHQPLGWTSRLKLSHHTRQFVYIHIRRIIRSNGIIYSPLLQLLVYLVAYQSPKLIIASKFKSNHLILACYVPQHFASTFVLYQRKIISILSYQRKERHQVRLTGSIITNYLKSKRIMTCCIIKILAKFWDDNLFVGCREHEVTHQRLTIIVLAETVELNDLINRLKRYKLGIFHC